MQVEEMDWLKEQLSKSLMLGDGRITLGAEFVKRLVEEFEVVEQEAEALVLRAESIFCDGCSIELYTPLCLNCAAQDFDDNAADY